MLKRSRSGVSRFWTAGLAVALLLVALNPEPAAAASDNSSEAGNEASRIYAEANTAYNQGRYEQALEGYKQLVKAGFNGGGLYYNLGNTYLRLKDRGHAVLYYEKARRVIPRDAALRANLALALEGVDEGRPGWLHETYRSAVALASLNQLALFGAICFFLLMIALCCTFLYQAHHSRRPAGKFRSWWSGFLVFTGVLTVMSWTVTFLTYLDQRQIQAVAVKPGAAYFETLPDAAVAFRVVPGFRMRVLKREGDWSYIERRDGRRGWVRQDCYEEI